jgi:hypothetical protein
MLDPTRDTYRVLQAFFYVRGFLDPLGYFYCLTGFDEEGRDIHCISINFDVAMGTIWRAWMRIRAAPIR